jgi:ribosomal protein S18 acetylase RimI-like enzyme
MISIRRANTDDHDTLVELWVDAGFGRLGEDEWNVLVAHPAAVVFVAELEGAVVGTAVASFDGWRAYLYHVAVAPQARRGGVARALMNEAAEHLYGEGARSIHVTVHEDNTAGLALSAAAGYLPVGEIVLVSERATAAEVRSMESASV